MYSEDDESQEESYVNYKQKYRQLKKHLRALIYENECLQDELRKAQRNFVSISRDKSFLLDRILKYEKPSLSTDTEVTESSDEDEEASRAPQYGSPSSFPQRKKITKRKRSEAELSNGGNSNQSLDIFHGHSSSKVTKPLPSKPVNSKQPLSAKKPKKPPAVRRPTIKKERTNPELPTSSTLHQVIKGYSLGDMQVATEEQVHTGSSIDFADGSHKYEFSSGGQMTREDIERHLEARRFSPEIELNTTPTVPAELFSQDPDHDSDLEGSEICEFVQLEDGTSADMILE